MIKKVRNSCEKTADSVRQLNEHMRQGLSNDNELLTIFKEVAQRLTQLTDEIKGLREDMYPKEDMRLKIDRPQKIKKLQPGQKMPDGTIYLGQYEPKDRDGVSLRKTFNVFAAPEDLPETMKYVDAVKHIAKLKKWNGYDGTDYATDKELYAAIKSGSYNGGWIIPTRDILRGNDVDGKATTPDNLYAHKDKGALAGTFCTAASSGSDYPDWYWSSTEDRGHPSYVRTVRFSDGLELWDRKDHDRLSCRPVRLVEGLVAFR